MNSAHEVPRSRLGDLVSLFPKQIPNEAVLQSLALTDYPATAFADDVANPRQCIIKSGIGYAFISKGCTDQFLGDALRSLSRRTWIFMVWPDDRPMDPSAPPHGGQWLQRREFRGAVEVPSTVVGLPRGFEFVEVDESILERCLWKDLMISACGSTRAFVEHAMGLCVVDGEKIAVEVYAPFWGENEVEIGVITHTDYRKQGLGLLACLELIRKCQAKGYSAVWSCHESNSGSIALARRIGFPSERRYNFLIFEPT